MLNSLNVDQKTLSNHPDLVNQLAEDVPMSAQPLMQMIVSVDSVEANIFLMLQLEQHSPMLLLLTQMDEMLEPIGIISQPVLLKVFNFTKPNRHL
jgi:predicted ATPase